MPAFWMPSELSNWDSSELLPNPLRGLALGLVGRPDAKTETCPYLRQKMPFLSVSGDQRKWKSPRHGGLFWL